MTRVAIAIVTFYHPDEIQKPSFNSHLVEFMVPMHATNILT